MELKKKLKDIEEAVSVIEDEHLRKLAFQKLLDTNFAPEINTDAKGEGTKTQEQVTKASTTNNNGNASDIESCVNKMARELGVEAEQLHEHFDFQEDNVRIYNAPTEKSRTKIQLKSLQMLSLILKKCYGKTTLNATDVLGHSNIPTDRIDNLTKSKTFKKLFSGSALDMKLTWAGEKESKQLLKNHIQ